MYDVFISYRRNGGEHTAKIIRDRLCELGYEVFYDVESLRSGNFNEKLYSVIDECKDFVLILSPGALDRCVNEDDWVRKEVEHAISKNKNIVPVMLRDFSFGCPLPKSMESLPYLNAIEANSQFFDAFIEKLQQFLKSRPSLMQRLRANVLLRKTIPLIIAIAVVLGVVIGIKTWYDSSHSLYPGTKEEVNLLKEVVYTVATDLTKLDIIAGAEENAYDAALRYLKSETKDEEVLRRELGISKDSITDIDESKNDSWSDLLKRLYDTPYDVADINAMSDAVATYKEDGIDNIEYIEYILSPEALHTNEEKLQIVECYKAINREYMKIYAYGTNELFLHITDRDALSELFEIILPELVNIPLSEAGWLNSKSSIESATDEAFNNIESLTMKIASIVGNANVDLNEEKNALKINEKKDLTPDKSVDKMAAEYYAAVERVSEKEEKKQVMLDEIEEGKKRIREMCQPLQTDDADTLWVKMTHLLYLEYYEDANVCIDMFAQKTTDTYSSVYIPVLRKYAQRVKTSGEKGGIMVVDYEFPDSDENVLRVGDIIVSFNGKSCMNGEEYSQYKDALSSDTYKVGVLRVNSSGELKETSLTLQSAGPRVYMYNIMYSPKEQE